MIRSEDFHAKHPYRAYVGWALFYIVLILAAVFIFLQFASSLHTQSVPQGSVTLKIPYAKYLSGEAITFSVTNNYNSTISITNNCPQEPLAVYRQINKTWRRTHATSKVNTCSEKLRTITIEPGQTVSGSYKNWPGLFKTPGKYRVAVFVQYFGAVAYQDVIIVKRPKTSASSTSSGSSTTKTIVVPGSSSANSSSSAGNQTNDNDNDDQPAAVQPPTQSSQSATIPVGGKGTVVLSYTSSQITVVSVTPNAGCSYEGTRPGFIGSFIEITFKCGGETQLQAWLSGGALRTKIEND